MNKELTDEDGRLSFVHNYLERLLLVLECGHSLLFVSPGYSARTSRADGRPGWDLLVVIGLRIVDNTKTTTFFPPLHHVSLLSKSGIVWELL